MVNHAYGGLGPAWESGRAEVAAFNLRSREYPGRDESSLFLCLVWRDGGHKMEGR